MRLGEGPARAMKVEKWQGLGNDYLVIEQSALPVELTPAAVRVLCDSHLGLGSDGVLLREEPTGAIRDAVVRMRIFNPDGSESEMCGNGMRIFARYLLEQGVVEEGAFMVETLAGAIRPEVAADGRVRVDMGTARFYSDNVASEDDGADLVDREIEVGGRSYRFTFVDVGNPHCVILVEDPAAVDVASIGPLIEHHALFPNRVNVEFVALEADGSVRMRVWERGVGETQACGTGATAVGAACLRLGRAKSPMVVHLLGGDLVIEAEADRDDRGKLRVHMTGPAEKVYEATLSDDLMYRLGWRR